MSELEKRMMLTEDQIDLLVKHWGMDDIDRCIQNLEFARAAAEQKLAEIVGVANELSWDRRTRGLSERILAIVRGEK